MAEILKMLYDGLEKHGLKFTIEIISIFIVLAIITLVFLWLKNKISKDSNNVKVTVNLDEEKHDEHTWNELLKHSFFRSIQKMINYEIHHLDIKERLRRAVFRDFLLIVFTIIHDNIRIFISSGDMDKMSSEEFHDKLFQLVDKFVQDYERTAKNQGIPDVIIEKFNIWNKDQVEMIYKFINDICEADDWYTTNSIKFYSFLNQMTSILDITLIHARKTLISLNGELDRVVYNGIRSSNKYPSYKEDSVHVETKVKHE